MVLDGRCVDPGPSASSDASKAFSLSTLSICIFFLIASILTDRFKSPYDTFFLSGFSILVSLFIWERIPLRQLFISWSVFAFFCILSRDTIVLSPAESPSRDTFPEIWKLFPECTVMYCMHAKKKV